MKWSLFLAGLYNLAFGLWTILWPDEWFRLAELPAPLYPQILQCVGMIVGVYGIGYLIAAIHPIRHWPIVLVGLMGKVLGPLGFFQAVSMGVFPWKAGWLILTNDVVWWIPFSIILWQTLRVKVTEPFLYQDPMSLDEAVEKYRLSTGETLAAASYKRPLALVFLRHFGCTFTRKIIVGLTAMEEAAGQNQAQLVLVHMLRPGEEKAYIDQEHPHQGVARVSDPHCELYRAFGLGKGGFLELFGPRVWLHGFLALFGGCGVGRLAGDGFQMPGAFLFHQGKVIRSQPARDASDLPDLPRLFQA